MSKHINKVWFITTELEGERASSFRQVRWCSIYLNAGCQIRIFNLNGAFKFSDTVINSQKELDEYRRKKIKKYAGPNDSVREGRITNWLRKIKHFTMADLYLPNIFLLTFHINKVLKNENEKILIVSSSPPYSTILVGYFIKRLNFQKIIFSTDLRDAWALHTSLGGIKKIKKYIEKKTLKFADYTSTVSYGLSNEFNHSYEISMSAIYNIATHYFDYKKNNNLRYKNNFDFTKIDKKLSNESIKIVYTGSIPDNFYDVKMFINAVNSFYGENPDHKKYLQFVFIGACKPLKNEYLKCGNFSAVGDGLVFIQHLPNEDIRSIQASADVLLFFGYLGFKNSGVVSTKIFEYLLLEKPILALNVFEGSDVNDIFVKYCSNNILLNSSIDFQAAFNKIAMNNLQDLPILKRNSGIEDLTLEYNKFAEKTLR